MHGAGRFGGLAGGLDLPQQHRPVQLLAHLAFGRLYYPTPPPTLVAAVQTEAPVPPPPCPGERVGILVGAGPLGP